MAMSIGLKKMGHLVIALAAAVLLTMLMASAAFASHGDEQSAHNDAYAENVSTAVTGDASADRGSTATSGNASARSSSSQDQSIEQNQGDRSLIGIDVNLLCHHCGDGGDRQTASNVASAFNDAYAESGGAFADRGSTATSGDAEARSSSEQRQRIERN